MMRFFQIANITLLIILIFLTLPVSGQIDASEKQIVSAITDGNATDLSEYFNTVVDLSIPGKEDTYGKTQAARILRDFFNEHPVKSYKTSKQGTSNDGSRFYIGRMESGSKIFRIYYLIKQSSGKYLIHQFQIQEEN